MAASVLVLGGGVGGLSAAHELVERGFTVTVLEQRDVPGGKARSLLVPGSALPPNQPLPGEHGFRFFPGFYRHVIDTMQRIPADGGGSVADHLVAASLEMLARMGKPPIELLPHQPHTLHELRQTLRTLFTADTGLSDEDIGFFALKLWQLMTACPERALKEFENQSWTSFMDAANRSPAFNQYFIEGLTRCLVAARRQGPARLQAQYVRANVEATERYVLSVAGSTAKRLAADGSGLSNLVLAGDWTHGAWNAGCIEAATNSGIRAAQVLRAKAGA